MRPSMILSPVVLAIASSSGTNIFALAQGVQRVKIGDFTLSLCPSLPTLDLVTLDEIRNQAESSAEEALQSYDWGNTTSYQYAGLAGVGNFSNVGDCTEINILGGLVSFSSTAQAPPTLSLVESIVADALNSESFKSSLQSSFPSITTVTYKTVIPSSAPSQSPPSAIPAATSASTQETRSSNSMPVGVIIGASVGGVVGILVVAVLLMIRRRQRAAANGLNGTKEIPTVPNHEPQNQLQKKPSDSTLESGGTSPSGPLGRMLAAAKASTIAVHRNAHDNDTSQGSTRDESAYEDESSYSSDYIRIRVLEHQQPPPILPVLSLESFEEDKGRHVLKKDMMISETTFPAWRTSPGSSPDETNVPCALKPTDLSAKALAAEWASTSLLDRAMRGKDDRSSATGESDARDFALDDLWDPDDCGTSIASQRSDPFLQPHKGLNANRIDFSKLPRSGSDTAKYQIPHNAQNKKAQRSRSYNQS